MSDYDYCEICGLYRICKIGVCEQCYNASQARSIRGEPHHYDYYDEPMFYECAMCGAEMIDYEEVRGSKYCRTCASIERHG